MFMQKLYDLYPLGLEDLQRIAISFVFWTVFYILVERLPLPLHATKRTPLDKQT